MFDSFPKSALDVLDWSWEQYRPYAEHLLAQPLNQENARAWLADWSRFAAIYSEAGSRISVAITLDTTDKAAEDRFNHFVEQVVPEYSKWEHLMNVRLIESGVELGEIAVPMRRIRANVAIFREENVPLFTELQKLGTEYDKMIGAQTVTWEGEEKTIAQMRPVLMGNDRARREEAWKLIHARQLQDRAALNALWVKLLRLRQQIAHNAGFSDFRAYAWQALGRFDYTPEDTLRFHEAIEQVVVPAVQRLNEKRRAALGVDALRPWDLDVDPQQRPPLKPFQTGAELEAGTARIFQQVDADLGRYFGEMADRGLLDLENRKGKAPGGYCTSYANIKRPFIFMNAVGIHDDVQTMLHEAGHAFHVFETEHLPFAQQQEVPMEFCEVASMAMELLAAPNLSAGAGGFYSEAEAARARVEHFEGMLRFWPYMSVVDSFQHWVYTSGDAALDPSACDAKWTELWQRFMAHGVDYSGLETWVMTGWHRKLHIFHLPFYYIEYGLAQLGAAQVWANSLKDHAGALRAYRSALALGGTATLPQLYQSAGAKLAFDAETLGSAVSLIGETITTLELSQ